MPDTISDRIAALELETSDIEEAIAELTSFLEVLYNALGLEIPSKPNSSNRDGGKVENPSSAAPKAPPG